MASELTVPAAPKRNDQTKLSVCLISQLKEEFHLQRGKIILNISSPTNTQDLSAGIGNYTGMVPFACVDSISKCAVLLFLCRLDITAVAMRGNNLRDFYSTRRCHWLFETFSHLLPLSITKCKIDTAKTSDHQQDVLHFLTFSQIKVKKIPLLEKGLYAKYSCSFAVAISRL